ALTRCFGVQITQMQDLPANRIFTTIRGENAPEYLPPHRRMEEHKAWDYLEGFFPGVNRGLIELLIAAKGCAEYRAGLPPIVFLTGPTGAGKTQSVYLAAAICGDRSSSVKFSRQDDRVKDGVAKAKQRWSFAFFDEFLKGARREGIPVDQAMELVLDLDPETMSHELYVGQVALGELPACVWADTAMPPEVAGPSQIARRMHLVQLREGRDWRISAKDLRHQGQEACRAADSILSAIMDRRFPPGPATDFADVARDLGFKPLKDDTTAVDKERWICTLFDLVCAAPAITGAAARRVRGEPGWKAIDPSGSGDLAEAWAVLRDAGK